MEGGGFEFGPPTHCVATLDNCLPQLSVGKASEKPPHSSHPQGGHESQFRMSLERAEN